MPIKIGIVDDHKLIVESLQKLLECENRFKVVLTAISGKDLQLKLAESKILPEIMLVDVNMPHMNGFQTTVWLKENYPTLKIVALSMKDDELTIIRMIKAGCCSYLVKDIDANELELALEMIHTKGTYRGDYNSVNSRRVIVESSRIESLKITDTELVFLNLACSDLTYKDIALKMHISERTVDMHREHLFAKLNVGSRVGLCLEAVNLELVEYHKIK